MKYLSLLLLLLIVSVVFADDVLQITLRDDTYNLFYASYIDPDNPASQPILFSGSVTNPSSVTVLNYYLKVGMTWNGNMLIDIEDADSRIIAVDPLNPGGIKQFDSRDILSNIPTNGFTGSLTMDGVLDNNPDFEDAILNTGRFPDGIYIVTVQAFDDATDNAISEPITLSIQIINPVNIRLLFPGMAAGSTIISYPTQQPTFMWISNLTDYTLKIFEIDDITSVSAEDIENNTPYAEITNIPSTAYAYPASAPMLEIGKIYGWQVTAPLVSPAGSSNISKSPVFIFRVENPNADPIQMEILYSFIRNLQGVDGMEGFVDLLNQGYAPTGNVIYQGQTIDFTQLNEFLSDIISGEIEVKSIIIE